MCIRRTYYACGPNHYTEAKMPKCDYRCKNGDPGNPVEVEHREETMCPGCWSAPPETKLRQMKMCIAEAKFRIRESDDPMRRAEIWLHIEIMKEAQEELEKQVRPERPLPQAVARRRLRGDGPTKAPFNTDRAYSVPPEDLPSIESE